MDKFDKHIKKQYEQQLKPVNANKAWERFEAERLDPNNRTLWLLLVCVLLLFGLSAIWFFYESDSYESSIEEKVLISDVSKSKQLSSNQVLLKNSEGKTKGLIESSIDGKLKVRKDLFSNGSIDIKSNNLITDNISEEVKLLKQEDDLSGHSEKLMSLLLDKKQKKQFTNDIEGEGTLINDAIIDSPGIYPLESSTEQKNTSVLFPGKSGAAIQIEKEKKWFSYGIYAGTNLLKHRFINQSTGANLGFVLKAKLTNHISIHALGGYSFIDLETRVNSKDLRIDGLNINTRSLEVTAINKSIHQLNSGIELAFKAFSSRSYNLDVTGGLITKVDFSASHVYQIFEDNMEQEIQKLSASNYYYPLFYRLSSAISYSFNKTRIALRPYYIHNVFASEVNYPFEWGSISKYSFDFFVSFI